MEFKREVARSFSIGSRLYDRLSFVQRLAGDRLLEVLKGIDFERAVDIGSGSGRLASRIGAIGIDISFRMCRVQLERGVPSICGDAEILPLKDSSFDLAVSNFSLQWMELNTVFQEVGRVLRKGGYFAFSIPVHGSLRELFGAWNRVFRKHYGRDDRLFRFMRKAEVLEALEGFEVASVEMFSRTLFFKTARQAVKAVTGIGARNPFRKLSITKGFYRDFEEEFRTERGFPISYSVLIALVRNG